MTNARPRLVDLFQLWFGVTRPVSQRAYLFSGLFLLVVKYAGEAWMAHEITGKWLLPWEFFSPLGEQRFEIVQAIGPVFWLWTIIFLWIALSMSARRAVDAYMSPWMGIIVLIPILNCFLVLILLAAPPYRSDEERFLIEPAAAGRTGISAFPPFTWDLLALLFGPIYTLLMLGAVIYLFEDYGAIFFFGGPVIIGAVTATLSRMGHPGQNGRAIGIAQGSLAASGLTLMLLALEGAICLVMAAPIALMGGLLGAGMGIIIAQAIESNGMGPGGFAAVLLLPGLAFVESHAPAPPARAVTSQIIVNAPPDVVWDHVIDFPPLTETPEWYFRAGIACPIGATIDGQGVGAIRRCQFTTGDFVEPITVWDKPRRLAFDVASQPHPMAEVNPFGDPHPPHLDNVLRSQRGEFRLEPLPGGQTRLIGTTWYQLHMRPQNYWAVWSDGIIHRIHLRVLRHVKTRAEIALQQ